MENYADLGYNKVFVSLDGTEAQDKVLERAIVVAANNNAELYIGHVVDSTALEASFRNSIEGLLEEARNEPRIKSVDITIKTGRIRETLKEQMLDVIKPDIVVCGARGLSSIKYALLGSISTFLLRNTECDILVVK